MTNIIAPVVGASYIHQRLNGGIPDRAPTSQANPVGNTRRISRFGVVKDKARVLNPKLNHITWSSHYAQHRTPMSNRTSKGMPYG